MKGKQKQAISFEDYQLTKGTTKTTKTTGTSRKQTTSNTRAQLNQKKTSDSNLSQFNGTLSKKKPSVTEAEADGFLADKTQSPKALNESAEIAARANEEQDREVPSQANTAGSTLGKTLKGTARKGH